jgi:hypothetical protein
MWTGREGKAEDTKRRRKQRRAVEKMEDKTVNRGDS